jgi:hypothetical protein
MLVLGTTLYVLAENDFFSFNTAGSATLITGNVVGDTTGPVYMAHDGTNIMVVTPGDDGWVWPGAGNLAVIADADFPTSDSLTWQDGYFIVGKENTGQFFISTGYDPTAWDATDFATAEGFPDNLMRVYSHHRLLWLFGSETTEVWYNSGAAAFPFERVSGVFLPYGTTAPASVASMEDMIFWLDHKKKVVMATGYSVQPISTHQIEYQIAQYTSVTDAIGFTYEWEGQKFYQITFPTGDDTWVYDLTTGLWHERQHSDGTRDRAYCYAYFNNKHLIGDLSDGKIYEWDPATFDDKATDFTSTRTTAPIHSNAKRIVYNSFEVDMESGVGNAGVADPDASLEWSDDFGTTWATAQTRKIGTSTENTKRLIWRRLGAARERIFRLTISDAVKRVVLGAYADIEVLDH